MVAPIVMHHTPGSALNFAKFTVGTGGGVVVNAVGIGSATGNVKFVPGFAVSFDAFALADETAHNSSTIITNSTIAFGGKTIAFVTVPSAANSTTAAGTAKCKTGGTSTLSGAETPGNFVCTDNAAGMDN